MSSRDRCLDDFSRRSGAEAGGRVTVGGDNGELFEDVQVKGLALNLLASSEVEDCGVKVCSQQPFAPLRCLRFQDWNFVAEADRWQNGSNEGAYVGWGRDFLEAQNPA